MNAFHRKQIGLIFVVVVALIFSIAASGLLRGILQPIAWGPPIYINPIYWFPFLFYGAVGLFTVFRADDHAWPWFIGFVGLWILAVAFEDSILQWFTFQLGFSTIGGRVNPIGITASLVAMGAAILLHVNQLARGIRHGLAERGLDPRELRQIEEQAWRLGLSNVVTIAGFAAVGSVILWIGGFALGRARIGIGALGILGGLLILAIVSAMAYRLLHTGPAPVGDVEEEELTPRNERRPPRGLR